MPSIRSLAGGSVPNRAADPKTRKHVVRDAGVHRILASILPDVPRQKRRLFQHLHQVGGRFHSRLERGKRSPEDVAVRLA